MNTGAQRSCPSCGNESSGAMEFCPVCLLREGFGGGVESGDSSFQEAGEGRKGGHPTSSIRESVGVTARFRAIDFETVSSPKVVINKGRRRTRAAEILFRKVI
jgi:hypothetical protein